MTTPLDWPSDLVPAGCEFGLQRQSVVSRSQISSNTQAYELGSEFWKINVNMPAQARASAGGLESFVNQIVGSTQSVNAWHFGRPIPIGTMRGSPTLNASVAQFAKTIKINTTGTLLRGDMFGVGGQLFQVAADASPVAGVLTVTTVNRVRVAISSGAAVTWYRPVVPFICLEQSSAFMHSPDAMAGTSLTLVEDV